MHPWISSPPSHCSPSFFLIWHFTDKLSYVRESRGSEGISGDLVQPPAEAAPIAQAAEKRARKQPVVL